MASKKQPFWINNVHFFLEDGTPLTKENEHLAKAHDEVIQYHVRNIYRFLNGLPSNQRQYAYEKIISL